MPDMRLKLFCSCEVDALDVVRASCCPCCAARKREEAWTRTTAQPQAWHSGLQSWSYSITQSMCMYTGRGYRGSVRLVSGLVVRRVCSPEPSTKPHATEVL